jgi:hypothetical protein
VRAELTDQPDQRSAATSTGNEAKQPSGSGGSGSPSGSRSRFEADQAWSTGSLARPPSPPPDLGHVVAHPLVVLELWIEDRAAPPPAGRDQDPTPSLTSGPSSHAFARLIVRACTAINGVSYLVSLTPRVPDIIGVRLESDRHRREHSEHACLVKRPWPRIIADSTDNRSQGPTRVSDITDRA